MHSGRNSGLRAACQTDSGVSGALLFVKRSRVLVKAEFPLCYLHCGHIGRG